MGVDAEAVLLAGSGSEVSLPTPAVLVSVLPPVPVLTVAPTWNSALAPASRLLKLAMNVRTPSKLRLAAGPDSWLKRVGDSPSGSVSRRTTLTASAGPS